MKTVKFYMSALISIILGFYCPGVFALDPMGPPSTDIEQGQFKLGAEYSHSNMNLELNNGIWIEYLDGIFYDEGDAVDLTIKNFKTNRGYINIGYGIVDNCETFLRLGGSKARFGDSIWEDSEKFNSRAEPAIGLGVKATFFEEYNLKLGGLLQANWAGYDGKLNAKHWASPDFVEADIAEIQIAVGLTCALSDCVSVYGGPFLHFIDGELEDIFSEVDPVSGGLLKSKYSWDIEQDSTFGGYLGTQMELAENCSLNIEFQHTAAADAFGANVFFRF
jgi:hypothetical protein